MYEFVVVAVRLNFELLFLSGFISFNLKLSFCTNINRLFSKTFLTLSYFDNDGIKIFLWCGRGRKHKPNPAVISLTDLKCSSWTSSRVQSHKIWLSDSDDLPPTCPPSFLPSRDASQRRHSRPLCLKQDRKCSMKLWWHGKTLRVQMWVVLAARQTDQSADAKHSVDGCVWRRRRRTAIKQGVCVSVGRCVFIEQWYRQMYNKYMTCLCLHYCPPLQSEWTVQEHSTLKLSQEVATVSQDGVTSLQSS